MAEDLGDLVEQIRSGDLDSERLAALRAALAEAPKGKGKRDNGDTWKLGDRPGGAKKLTRDFVRKVKPRGRTVRYHEGHGFALRLTATGARSYTLDYRDSIGRSRRATFGSVEDLDLDTARKRASEWRDKIRQGIDPQEEIAERKGAATVADLWKRVEAEHLPQKAPSTRKMFRLAFEKHLLPTLRRKRVDGVRWEDFAAILARLRREGSPYMGNRVIASARKAWALAARWGLWPREMPNPATGHDLAPERRRGVALTVEQLAALGTALDREPDGSIPAAAFKVLLFTGARPAEITSMRWDDLDETGRVLNLPESKTGPRAVYIGRPAAEILAELPRKSDTWVFPSPRNRGKHLADLRALWGRISERAELPAGVRLYDAGRHTYATTAAKLGIPTDRRKLLTGHAHESSDAHSRYLHLDPATLLPDADRVAGALALALRGKAGELAPVVSIAARNRQ